MERVRTEARKRTRLHVEDLRRRNHGFHFGSILVPLKLQKAKAKTSQVEKKKTERRGRLAPGQRQSPTAAVGKRGPAMSVPRSERPSFSWPSGALI